MPEKLFSKPVNAFFFSVLCTFLWGSAFPCIKLGYESFAISAGDIGGKLLFAGIRFVGAGLLTLGIFWIMNRRVILPKKEEMGGICAVGFVMTFFQYVCFYIGMANTTAVRGSILNATETFFAVVMAHFFTKNDRMTVRKGLGCLLGFLGILAINLKGMEGGAGHLLGDGLIIVAGFSFAAGTTVNKRVSARTDPTLLTGCQLFFGGLLLIAGGLICQGRLSRVTAGGLSLLAYMATLSAVAFTLWSLLMKYNKMSKISIYNFLTPVFGGLLSALVLGEEFFRISTLLALCLVCGGICVVNTGGGADRDCG